MHRLRALIWRAYKVRLRSPLPTTLDLLGPIATIMVYLLLKIALTSLVDTSSEPSDHPLVIQANLNAGGQLERHLCTETLYYSTGAGTQLVQRLADQCGLKLAKTSARSELVSELRQSLSARIAYRQAGTDLNKASANNSGCPALSDRSGPVYQLGLFADSASSLEVFMTDTGANQIIHQPYTLGSSYNEYRLPQSDLNSGLHLLALCLAGTIVPAANSTLPSGWKLASFPTTAASQTVPLLFMVFILVANFFSGLSTVLRVSEDNENGLHHYLRCSGVPAVAYWTSLMLVILIQSAIQSLVIAILLALPTADYLFDPISDMSITLRWPLLFTYSSAINVHAMFVGSLFNRSSHAIMVTCILAIIYCMSPPITFMLQWNPYEFSPLKGLVTISLLNPVSAYESLLLVLYALTMQTSQPLTFDQLHLGILGGGMSDLTLGYLWLIMLAQIIGWFSLTVLVDQIRFSPSLGGILVSMADEWYRLGVCCCCWCCSCCCSGLASHNGQQEDPGSKGNPDRSAPELKLKLALKSKGSGAAPNDGEVEKATTAAIKEAQLAASASKASRSSNMPDPNRVCCSVRQLSVAGPTQMMAHTRGDPLRLGEEQFARQRELDKQAGLVVQGKAQQYLINRNQVVRSPNAGVGDNKGAKSVPTSPLAQQQLYRVANDRSKSAALLSGSQRLDQPILLDEAVQQHIIWRKTPISFEGLSVDFHFNQVTFVLGQTNLKDLLFASLLGLEKLSAGHIVLDGVRYGAGELSLARSQIGYLAEHEIYLSEMSIFENLQFFGSLRSAFYTEYDSESLFVLSLLKLYTSKDSLPAVLTNRSARKLALAVAAVGHTKLLLLVEPTLSLRWKPRCQVLNLLKKYKSIRSIVVDTSDVDEAAAFGDRILLLKDGRANLDGTPERLSRQLKCGYWLVFQTAAVGGSLGGGARKSAESGPGAASMEALEKLAAGLFKQDKLDRLEVTTRSVHEELVRGSPARSPAEALKSSELARHKHELNKRTSDNNQRPTVILKVRHSHSSVGAVCTLLRMFPHGHSQHGFNLAELAYESLEDALVLKMSRAIYPNLPPDLLLSLQHRSKLTDKRHWFHEETAPLVSVRRLTTDFQVPKVAKSLLAAKLVAVLKDRAGNRTEFFTMIACLLLSLVCLAFALWMLQTSLVSVSLGGVMAGEVTNDGSQIERLPDDIQVVDFSLVDELYKQRIGLYIVDPGKNSSDGEPTPPSGWRGNPKLAGTVPRQLKSSDSRMIETMIVRSRDLLASIIFSDPQTSETIILFEPHLPHAVISAINSFASFRAETGKSNAIPPPANATNDDKMQTAPTRATSLRQHNFRQSWHEIIQGYSNRRIFYGIGFALAEGIATGALVIAPVRHRSESRVVKLRITYWLAMATYDLLVSLVLCAGYIAIIIAIEGTNSVALISCMAVVLFLYKLATLPLAYLVSLVVSSSLNGFMFIMMVCFMASWVFAIHLATLIEWSLLNESYLFVLTNWIVKLLPISSLVDSMTIINHSSRINQLCPSVPAYLATSNIIEISGPQKQTVNDKLLEKVRECLASGKTGVSTNVLHSGTLGILWNIYLTILFAIIVWIFLMFSEKVFGLLARRFSSQRTSLDPMKSVVRTAEDTKIFKWDREKDRLVSEYVRCINEPSYVRVMATNCLYLRIWLRPLSDVGSINKQMGVLLEPLVSLGQPKGEIQMELRTTLQIFIRIGTETSRFKVDKVALIEAYSDFIKRHGDIVVKFAVTDWTREAFYKTLLHGHYNTKSTLAMPP